jgi:hypothetical protein
MRKRKRSIPWRVGLAAFGLLVAATASALAPSAAVACAPAHPVPDSEHRSTTPGQSECRVRPDCSCR